ncbi:hypothetical protein PVAP13_9NG324846 [Panicum virgatum]|uniref:Uncharacterized protein n=1 Tax=Panicum virgatum TaxID=38727 RepID=A0A8T0MMA1_PANVG|nr:hypothetical protein PVAP13_9NG324846 [Panicum virgatum]
MWALVLLQVLRHWVPSIETSGLAFAGRVRRPSSVWLPFILASSLSTLHGSAGHELIVASLLWGLRRRHFALKSSLRGLRFEVFARSSRASSCPGVFAPYPKVAPPTSMSSFLEK